MSFVFGRVVLIGSVTVANILVGYLAVLAGTSIRSVCFDSFSSAGASGCYEADRYMDWGPTQVAVFALMALSLLFLGAYLARVTSVAGRDARHRGRFRRCAGRRGGAGCLQRFWVGAVASVPRLSAGPGGRRVPLFDELATLRVAGFG